MGRDEMVCLIEDTPDRWHAYPAVARRRPRGAGRLTRVTATGHEAGPLAHLRVLDLSRATRAPYCTGVLADLGADVLRVEPRGTGDTTRMIPGAMEAYHRGKRAMTLDLKHDDAPAILRRLIADVDVVVESGLPAGLAAQGIDHATLAADQPGLVWCTISGFGEGSPYAKRPAHDITFLGYSGLMALMAGDTVPPTPDFVLAVPFGSLIAVVGILAALTERDRTGTGAFVDTAIVDSATWVLGEAFARVASGQPAGWGEAASRRAYRAADGKLVTLAAAEPRTWAAFCAAVDRPDLAGAPDGPARWAGGSGRGARRVVRDEARRRVGGAARRRRRRGRPRAQPRGAARRPAPRGARRGGRARRRPAHARAAHPGAPARRIRCDIEYVAEPLHISP